MSARRKVAPTRKLSAKARFLRDCHLQDFSWTIHLFTEGDTESRYICEIASSKCIKIVREGSPVSSPHVLMQRARDWVWRHRDLVVTEEGRRHIVWVVFDDDEKTAEINQTVREFGDPPTGIAAKKYATTALPPIYVGYMKPCIELWGMLAIKGSATGLPRTHDKMESSLARTMKGYSHKDCQRYFDVRQMGKTPDACAIAAKWEQTYGAFPACVNATYFAGIHKLVTLINNCHERV